MTASSPQDQGLASNDAVIEFRDVSYRLDSARELLHHLNLEARRWETLVLLGRSGSGKTTTLKLINRPLVTSEGEARVEARPTTARHPTRLPRRTGSA